MKETGPWLDRYHERADYFARHPVMTPEMSRQLPAGHALVIRGGHSPVIARLPMAWKDPAYRTARRKGATAHLSTADGSARLPSAGVTRMPGDDHSRETAPTDVIPYPATAPAGRYPWDE